MDVTLASGKFGEVEVKSFILGDPGCITAAPENCWEPTPDEIEYTLRVYEDEDDAVGRDGTPDEYAEVYDDAVTAARKSCEDAIYDYGCDEDNDNDY